MMAAFWPSSFRPFAGGEHGTTVGELHDDRGFHLGGSFQHGVVESVPTQLTAGRANHFSLAMANALSERHHQ